MGPVRSFLPVRWTEEDAKESRGPDDGAIGKLLPEDLRIDRKLERVRYRDLRCPRLSADPANQKFPATRFQGWGWRRATSFGAGRSVGRISDARAIRTSGSGVGGWRGASLCAGAGRLRRAGDWDSRSSQGSPDQQGSEFSFELQLSGSLGAFFAPLGADHRFPEVELGRPEFSGNWLPTEDGRDDGFRQVGPPSLGGTILRVALRQPGQERWRSRSSGESLHRGDICRSSGGA
jgi:hypothetical protein